MDAARSAIGKITGRTGHKTDVDETVNPSVTSETIKPHRHEETTEAIDREVHQDHYHTTVQPISHREVLPEQHTHNLAPQVNREFRHGDDRETQQRVNSELGQFQNSSTTRATTQSTAAAPSVTGEHVHHHVHETVQPVIHKETYQPEVVHTTVPIHETHHQKATHHGMSALPMKTLDEFKSSGGVLQGGQRSATHEEYDGAPRPYNEKLSTTIEKVLPGHHHQSGNVSSGTTGLTGQHHSGNVASGTTSAYGTTSGQNYGEDSFGRGNTSTTTNTTTSTSTQKYGQMGEHDRSNFGNTSTTGSQYTDSRDTSGSQQKSKPSMMDKLNPKVDSDGDGKAGFMK